MFKISEFSKLSQVPAKTLRFYDQIGLLKPAYTDDQNNYRYYTSEQLLHLHRIMAFKDLGFTLEQIKQLQGDNVPASEIRGMFRMKQAEVHSLIQAEVDRLRRIETRLRQIERGGGEVPLHEVLVKRVGPMKVVSIRETTSRASIPGLFQEMDDYLKWYGLSIDVPHMVLWHNCLECETAIQLEIACPISRDLPDTERFRMMIQPKMEVASVTYIGRPDTESVVSVDLGSWIEMNGYQISQELPGREVYLSRMQGEELAFVTDSQMPIVGKSPITF